MRWPPITRWLAPLLLSGTRALAASRHSEAFVSELEACIADHAAALSRTASQWGDTCAPVTTRLDALAAMYEQSLTPIFERHGYTAALWCAAFALGLPSVGFTNPEPPVWSTQLLCPWRIPASCNGSDEELNSDEVRGVRVCPWEGRGRPEQCAPQQHPLYAIWPEDTESGADPNRRTLSCALCARLRRTFAVEAPNPSRHIRPLPDDLRDMRAFGMWLANREASHKMRADDLLRDINLYKASEGEIEGYLSQSLRLLSRVGDAPLSVMEHAHRVCEPAWWLNPQSLNDCAKAAGQGYFHFFLDVGKAVLACTDPKVMKHAPGPTNNLGRGMRKRGLDGLNLLKWRWLCSTGVYHAAANSLSSSILRQIGMQGRSVEEYLCQHQNVWGANSRYFDRCAAGTGMADAEERLRKLVAGSCNLSVNEKASDWETQQLHQFGPQLQLSCNRLKSEIGFSAVISKCPLGLRMHFPCIPSDLDFMICTGQLSSADSAGGQKIVPYHRVCSADRLLRTSFECGEPPPHREGTNKQMYAMEWSEEHPNQTIPWNELDFGTKTPIGSWGGSCICPDGRMYKVADEGNACHSLACEGGAQAECRESVTEGAFRRVICAPLVPRRTASKNIVVRGDAATGSWGGTCACPDGEVYIVGDQNDACGSLACEGGRGGICNHYVSLWAHVKVKCDTSFRGSSLSSMRHPSLPGFVSKNESLLISTSSLVVGSNGVSERLRGHVEAFGNTETDSGSTALSSLTLVVIPLLLFSVYLLHWFVWERDQDTPGRAHANQRVRGRPRRHGQSSSRSWRSVAIRVNTEETDEIAASDVHQARAMSMNGSVCGLAVVVIVALSGAGSLVLSTYEEVPRNQMHPKAPHLGRGHAHRNDHSSNTAASSTHQPDGAPPIPSVLVDQAGVKSRDWHIMPPPSPPTEFLPPAQQTLMQDISPWQSPGRPLNSPSPTLPTRPPNQPVPSPSTPSGKLSPPPMIPPSMPTSPSPGAAHPEPIGEWYSLRSSTCSAMLHDRTHKFHQLWGKVAWLNRGVAGDTCWSYDHNFFENALEPAQCDANWLEGAIGGEYDRPPFSEDANPLLGFDGKIWDYCSELFAPGPWDGGDWNRELAWRCVRANLNILRIMFSCDTCTGSRAGWNMCRNFQWVLCAVRGLLPGQGRKLGIVFAKAPNELDIRGMDDPLRITDPGDSWWFEPHWSHYAVSDVFYGEVCMLSTICRNAWQLFTISRGEEFVCDFHEDGYRELVNALQGGTL